jgi:hypothetical protein
MKKPVVHYTCCGRTEQVSREFARSRHTQRLERLVAQLGA